MHSMKDGQSNGHSGCDQPPIGPRLFSVKKPPSLDDFKKLTTESVPCHYPLAKAVESNVPIYHLPDYHSLSPEERSALQDEYVTPIYEVNLRHLLIAYTKLQMVSHPALGARGVRHQGSVQRHFPA